MGGCLSKKRVANVTKNAEFRRTLEIENRLHMDKMDQKNDVKILLLGAGEAGKSTFLKQIRLIHEGTYTNEERRAFREIVVRNVLQCMLAVLDAQQHNRLTSQDHCILLLPAELVEAIDWLWHHPTIQRVYQRRHEFQLNDSADYYLKAIRRIGQPTFVPTDQDILRSRVKTTGIVETSFLFQGYCYRIYDIGGQRSERKKWIHYFDRVMVVIFLVAISEFDQGLYEDSSVNRLRESLDLFQSIWDSAWFRHTSFVLLLNKTDLFLQKWSLPQFQKCFPEYKGPDHAKSAQKHIQRQFEALKPKNNDTQLYSHFTCAIDTENINFVLAAVSDTILQQVMRHSGLLD
ncbi:guanine nucleotide-binding protein alpha subunit [Gongronella butleri]|nr:guanine nucleotide-binding protein alpha subunit [Gongronella butleri]